MFLDPAVEICVFVCDKGDVSFFSCDVQSVIIETVHGKNLGFTCLFYEWMMRGGCQTVFNWMDQRTNRNYLASTKQ